MAMRLPKFFSRVTKPRKSSTSWIATVSVISMISRSATPGCARISDSIDAHQSGSIVVSGEMLRLSSTFGEAADPADLPRHGDDARRQQHLPVILLHADQAFVECRIARAGLHHRLERH